MTDKNISEIFADGVHEISFGNGMIRMDLFSLSASEKDAKGQPVPEVRQRVVMTPQGFFDAFATMGRVMENMEQAGLVQRNPQAGAAEIPAETSAPAKPAAKKNGKAAAKKGKSVPPKSPNFG